MDAPIVTVGQQLKQDLSEQFAPVKVEVKQPNTGFAALDTPQEAPQVTPQGNNSDESVAPKANTPPAPDFDKRMAKIISQAQKNQADRQAFAAEQAKFKADMDELARFRDLKARAKEDPVSIAETFGYKPDEYATLLMEKGSLTPERRKILEQQQELNEMKQWRTQVQEKERQQEVQAQYSQVRSEMESFAAQNAEQFDLIHRTKSYDKVLGKIQDHFKQTEAMGEAEIMPYEEAFTLVERELEDYYAPVLESPKFRAKLTSAAAEQPSPTAPSPQLAARKPAGTITSKFRAQSAAPKELSEAERFQKAGEVLLSQVYGRRG